MADSARQKPRTYIAQAGRASTEREAEFKESVMTIRNGRLAPGERTLNREGFAFTPHESIETRTLAYF